MEKTFVHPYMPNSVPEIRQQLLDELGVKDVKEIYGSIKRCFWHFYLSKYNTRR